jgi:hypothetical protein
MRSPELDAHVRGGTARRDQAVLCVLVQVVVPQGVLVRASAELTVTQALEIADMTLETSCRAIQWAINVPEVLLASAGEGGGS